MLLGLYVFLFEDILEGLPIICILDLAKLDILCFAFLLGVLNYNVNHHV